MSKEIGSRARLGAVVVLLYAAGVSSALVDVVNYDNHPDLEKAKEYDLTVDNKKFMRADGTFDRDNISPIWPEPTANWPSGTTWPTWRM